MYILGTRGSMKLEMNALTDKETNMTVAELIAALQKLPQDAIVLSTWDDEPFATPIIGASWTGDDNDLRTVEDDGDDRMYFVNIELGHGETYEVENDAYLDDRS